jgi:protein-S-isoprenylcysteine O-methyltransferase Ste14
VLFHENAFTLFILKTSYMKTNNSGLGKILLKIPVPWVFILTYLLGLIPQFLIPFKFLADGNTQPVKIAGAFLFVIGALFTAWSLIIFREARTTTTPGESSKKLVMSGPYKYSRNPMYVSLTMCYLGEAGLLAQLWPVLFLPLMLLYLNKVVIPLEEEILSEDFKAEYKAYCSKVKRWL